ncbi:MAG: aminotransferase class I/II-fold pyridoxal phosphate-dependent enzyme [Desulfobacteraceae bacterium]|nr:aminotransferase class I/II-fold pyridoxal phosphate-dependent enzyme [Desulfobacteraceae bacterium]
MNPLAKELNEIIEKGNPRILDMLADVGKELFFPKGILTQSAEAKQKAHKLNATIGIAMEEGRTMQLRSVSGSVSDIRPGEYLTYAPSYGIAGLREEWKKSLYKKNPSLKEKQISLPVVVSGITHAISIFADVWVNPGDVIVIPEMMWGNYNMIFGVRHKARVSHYDFYSPSGGFNVAGLESRVREEAKTNKKIIVLLNFPHNPTGYAITKSEAEAVAKALIQIANEGTHIIAVMDDAYFGLFYEEDVLKESLFALLCQKHPNLLAVKLDGATKESYVWGLRVGFVTYGCSTTGDMALFYDALERKTAGCVRGDISNASHLGQSIILKSMLDKDFDKEKQEKYDILEARAKKVKAVLADKKYSDAWDVYPFNAGYFMCIRLKNVNAEKLRVHLLDKYGVGLISIGDKNLRVAFSCIDERDIQELFDIIYRGYKDLAG